MIYAIVNKFKSLWTEEIFYLFLLSFETFVKEQDVIPTNSSFLYAATFIEISDFKKLPLVLVIRTNGNFVFICIFYTIF